jgi:hypothetical protein
MGASGHKPQSAHGPLRLPPPWRIGHFHFAYDRTFLFCVETSLRLQPPWRIGHFHFACDRTFLFCVDISLRLPPPWRMGHFYFACDRTFLFCVDRRIWPVRQPGDPVNRILGLSEFPLKRGFWATCLLSGTSDNMHYVT